MRKYTLPWYYHPDKTAEWYEDQKKRRSEDAFAREIEINYSLSVSGKVFSPFREERHTTSTDPGFNPSLPVYRIWDFGKCNAALFVTKDNYGRVTVLHERVLGDGEKGSTFDEQKHVVLADSARLFNGAHFIDICDPAGDWDDHRGASPEVFELGDKHKIFPQFNRIKALPTRERKVRGRELIMQALQSTPGGHEALQLYVSPNGVEGCPILKKAFQGGYCYKKDQSGNILDRIHERHPYEDVIDCLIYFFLETDGYTVSNPADYQPYYPDDADNEWLGF